MAAGQRTVPWAVVRGVGAAESPRAPVELPRFRVVMAVLGFH